VIALLAVPILIQVYFNSGLAYLLNRAAGEAHCVAGPSSLIGGSNFFELAVAVAISLFGFELEAGRDALDEAGVLAPWARESANHAHDLRGQSRRL
jgi:ACR3 family arsenite efflux pump ArsB